MLNEPPKCLEMASLTLYVALTIVKIPRQHEDRTFGNLFKLNPAVKFAPMTSGIYHIFILLSLYAKNAIQTKLFKI